MVPEGQSFEIAGTRFREFALWSRDYQAAYSPWLARGQVMGVLGVALPSNFLVATEATSRDWFSAFFSLATVAIIILGYGLAQNIARPILRLRSMAQTVATGNLDQVSGFKEGVASGGIKPKKKGETDDSDTEAGDSDGCISTKAVIPQLNSSPGSAGSETDTV